MRNNFSSLLTLSAVVLMAACGEETVTRARVPKEAAPAAEAHGPGDGHDHGDHAGHDHAAAPGLKWTLASGWKETPGTGMRLATWTPPGGLKTEGTVVSLPGDSGGELANANRWRGQIGLPPTDEAGLAAARTKLSTKAGPVSVYDFTSEGASKTRLIAAVVKTGDTTWFFKLMGDAPATESARPGFLAAIKSLTP
ncbi:MAG: hypothetical protein NDJ72_03290 [Elusimicrobia bacterium]|nr:hypothetical protein [Elusimicrobiota bacterium]